MKKYFISSLLAFSTLFASAQGEVTIKTYPQQANQKISKHIYGHFAEHLGTCIYGGLWVGENSSIPNEKGYRKDVLEALKKLQIPNLRWPGGCFADEYHWMDGIGAKESRPKMVNNNWGGTIEDNSFGTHEFLNLCEILDCEPYISGNVGSGSVEEMAKWVEYMTSDGDSPMANLRRSNGRDKAWDVKFFGVGNESWGCGGNMRPEYYADLYRRYSTYCRDYDDNRLFKIASGASDYDYNWTEVLMKNIGHRMSGLSVHYYTITEWGEGKKGSAIDFTNDEYYWIIGKCLEIEEVLTKHMDIMDKYDKDKRIGLMVDEWGTWFNEEPGTIRGHLYQQNSMRDAFVAALSLNIFNKYGDRIQMANIAQLANVLQSMVLTKDDKMTLTPTYHVFEMYKAHQDATHIPIDLTSDTREIRGRNINTVSASVSQKGDAVNLTLTNIDLETDRKIVIDLPNPKAKNVNGRILTSKNITDHNTFEQPNLVKPEVFKDAKIRNGKLELTIPAKSILALEVQ
ncbi:alpha-N-arabinofuranosidase [Bacteroides propionicifaciens]|uniref:alpha-N-arabinofuranosidase n=1 Tax=Bacteroides propionicifaciens TaxID=392838 RepID=UPI00036BEC61|nr:alpha-L-arabinofuranosidase C-terminal domain-containing protein [Bacteroides propionicifaciens]